MEAKHLRQAKYGIEKPSFLNRFKRANPEFSNRLKKIANALGYEYGLWSRKVAYQACLDRVARLDIPSLDAMEISAGDFWRDLPFKSFVSMDYPEYDITRDTMPRQFDLIIADNVFEHLPYPSRAARNVLKMLRPGGYFIYITPFLVRIHNIPIDCTRWTETGMKYLLIDAGFDEATIETGAWGNRACVRANFKKWARRGFSGSMKNEPRFPITIWAIARSPRTAEIDAVA